MGMSAGILAGLGRGIGAFSESYYKGKASKRKEGIEDEDRKGRRAYLAGRNLGAQSLSNVSDVSTRGPAGSPEATPGSVSPAAMSPQTPGRAQPAGLNPNNPMAAAQREAEARSGFTSDMGRAGQMDRIHAAMKPQIAKGTQEYVRIEKEKIDVVKKFKALSDSREEQLWQLRNSEEYKIQTKDLTKKEIDQIESREVHRIDREIKGLKEQKGALEAAKGRQIVELLQIAMKGDPRLRMLIEQIFGESPMGRERIKQQSSEIMKPLDARYLGTK